MTQQYLDEYGITPKYAASIGGGWIDSAKWWLRSPNIKDSVYFWYITNSGDVTPYYTPTTSYGVCPCFSI